MINGDIRNDQKQPENNVPEQSFFCKVNDYVKNLFSNDIKETSNCKIDKHKVKEGCDLPEKHKSLAETIMNWLCCYFSDDVKVSNVVNQSVDNRHSPKNELYIIDFEEDIKSDLGVNKEKSDNKSNVQGFYESNPLLFNAVYEYSKVKMQGESFEFVIALNKVYKSKNPEEFESALEELKNVTVENSDNFDMFKPGAIVVNISDQQRKRVSEFIESATFDKREDVKKFLSGPETIFDFAFQGMVNEVVEDFKYNRPEDWKELSIQDRRSSSMG